MQSLSGDVSAPKTQIAEQLSTEVSELRREVSALKTEIADIGELRNDIGRLSGEVSALRSAAAPSVPSPQPIHPSPQKPAVRSAPLRDSRIISDIPEIFAEFRGKRFSLLWRGSRDGFNAQEFHGRCDGRANTLTVILDTEGNIFGGFTPLEWESWVWNGNSWDEDGRFKADDSLKSFLFTLKNPHDIPARRFALKAHLEAPGNLV
jgi:hypothetical protein